MMKPTKYTARRAQTQAENRRPFREIPVICGDCDEPHIVAINCIRPERQAVLWDLLSATVAGSA